MSDGAIQVLLRVRYEFPDDGPGTLLIVASGGEDWLRSVKTARIRLPDSDRWVTLGEPELGLGRDSQVLGLGTFELSEERRAFLVLKAELERNGGDLIVIEFEESGGRKTLCKLMSDGAYNRFLAKLGRRSGGKASVHRFGKVGA